MLTFEGLFAGGKEPSDYPLSVSDVMQWAGPVTTSWARLVQTKDDISKELRESGSVVVLRDKPKWLPDGYEATTSLVMQRGALLFFTQAKVLVIKAEKILSLLKENPKVGVRVVKRMSKAHKEYYDFDIFEREEK